MDIKDALEMVSLTHPGMVRAHNEDSVACEPSCGLVVLTDGMGGYNAGEVASGIAVSVVSSEIKYHLEDARPEDKDAVSGEDVAVAAWKSSAARAIRWTSSSPTSSAKTGLPAASCGLNRATDAPPAVHP